MGLIRKIVLTPIKWAAKKIIHKTLLTFPKEDSPFPVACVYCPEMCRFSCPTAVVTGNDAVTPRAKVSLLYKEQKWPGKVSQNTQLWPIYDCTGCGRCSDYCVYSIPVADILLEARKENKWDQVNQSVLDLIEQEDKVGDLYSEMGNSVNAKKKLNKFISNSSSLVTVVEPKELYYLRLNGIDGELSWKLDFNEALISVLRKKLGDYKWLIAESVWLNRRLKSMDAHFWVKELSQKKGFNFVFPSQSGKDCMETGGEGAYRFLFSEQAKQIALDYYERDKGKVDGILCFSDRMAKYFRLVLGSDVKVYSVSEIYHEQ